jgi:hypothetical protein
MKMDPDLPVQVAFAKGGPMEFEPVVPTLNALCDYVSDIVLAQLSTFV